MSKQRTALITGAARGIGRAIADRLAADGYNVLSPGRAAMDLASKSSIDGYLGGLKTPVDILINNAGINPLAGLMELNDEDVDSVMQTNLLAPLRLIKVLAPKMAQRKFGRIVNISSVWSVVSKSKRAIYSISKSALNALTRSAAVELAADNVLVNAIAPGFVNTELTRQNNSPAEIGALASSVPARRLAEPAEVAEVVAFLASEKNTYLTGQVIFVDGGFTCQ